MGALSSRASFPAVHPSLVRYVRFLTQEVLEGCCDPEDVLQEAYLKAWRQVEKFSGDTPREFSSWLREVIHLEVLNLRRTTDYPKRTLRRLDSAYQGDPVRLEEIPANRPSVAELLEETERTRTLMSAFVGLTQVQLRLITLVFVLDKSVKEAGRALGMETSAAHKCLRRATERLRDILERLPEFREEAE